LVFVRFADRFSRTGGVNEAALEYDAAVCADVVAAHSARGTSFVYLGTRHDAAAAARALGVPRAAALRFSPVLARTALAAAAEAVQEAVWRTGRVRFNDEHRLFALPARAHAWLDNP